MAMSLQARRLELGTAQEAGNNAKVSNWIDGAVCARRSNPCECAGIISAAGGRSGMLDLYGQATLERDFTPHMSLANALKDVRYYAEWLESAGLPSGLAEAVCGAYEAAAREGHAEEGCTAVIKPYERQLGVEAKLAAKKS